MSRPRRARTLLPAVVGAAALAAACAPTALGASALYWSNSVSNTIGRAALDGSSADQGFITGANYPRGVAVSARSGWIYWANNNLNTIGRARLDGSQADQSFITGANGPSGVAVDDTYVYWTNVGNGRISRARLDGTDVDPDFILGANTPAGLAVDAGHVYWANYGIDRIGRANIDGTGVNQSFINPGPSPHGVAVDGSHIWWTDYTSSQQVGRANLDGTGITTSVFSLPGLTFYMATDAAHLYWANAGSDTVGRANLDGTGADDNFITGGSGPFGVAAASWEPAATIAGDGAFGVSATGAASAARTFTLTSGGTGALKTGVVSLAGADASQFSLGADTCSGTWLAVGATCTVSVSFAPTTNGAKAATLTVPGDAAGGPATIALSGTGDPGKSPAPPAAAGPPTAGVVRTAQTVSALGRATMTVRLSGPGTVSMTAAALLPGRRVALPSSPVTAAGAGDVTVTLALPASVRARLARAGRVRLDVSTRTTGPNGLTLSVADAASPSLTAAPSAVLRGQWIGRTLGPWTHAPRLTGARRSALRVTHRGATYTARVVR